MRHRHRPGHDPVAVDPSSAPAGRVHGRRLVGVRSARRVRTPTGGVGSPSIAGCHAELRIIVDQRVG